MNTVFKMTVLPALLVAASFTQSFAASQPASPDDWQTEMLTNPSENQLALERRGRIFIYSGLKDTQVAGAMDTQFDRIGSMMFVRTVVTNEDGDGMSDPDTGEPVVEDDGC